jgi:hypothetical protein
MKSSVALLFLSAAVAGAAEDRTQYFDTTSGITPKHWTSGVTGKGEALWQIEKDRTAPSGTNVLRKSGVAEFAVMLKDAPLLQDGFVEVKGKAISGKEDQAIGVVWRAKDTDNYYVCRANALENNIVLYKTVDGKRTPLDIAGRTGGYGVEAKVEPKKWHTLRVEFAGDTFKVLWNGNELFQVKDATFRGEGKTGLWTKADSVTAFDNFSCGDRSPGAVKLRAAAKPYPLKWCLCTEDRLDDTKNTEELISFIHNGQEIRLCCTTCKKDFFDKDPEKYLKRLADAVAANQIENSPK